ncbi:AEC family transporter [Sinorhizobium medicae]|uniref:Auxin Efflux Carrier n=1 Tax=Sinorhizobium medicae TaxID=110321 RepID=A0A508X1J0_9HYPH|nr:AEC family transporter [Sinorhizobium medicae]MDX0421886.1 AEC family transporter [Sinorhizobium medicae]MDX0519453.1 AEC family transporter [Sinorhizobium medicae]MDX0544252.1 AEC family transporter [Sinorhizobium medicae]MDX0632139.1 AEC family transporter [Sinorhizobium medicae]MDX0711680.1 AEC family transporter [Sinorhizobium medicae]
MSDVFLNVLPIFVLILTGWLIVRLGYLKPAVGEALGDFVFRVAVPVLLFRTIAEADFKEGSPWPLWVAYFSGVAVTWAIGHLAATIGFGRDARMGVLAGVSSAFANTVFIGLPLVSRLVGEDGIVALSILLSVHLPVMMIAGTVLMERADRQTTGTPGQGIWKLMGGVARNLVRNPLVIGLACGALFHLLGQPLGGPVKTVVDQLAGVAAPAALVSIGMALDKYGLAGNTGLATVTSTLKLLVLPGAVFAACHLLGLNDSWTAALVLTSSVPTGVNAWLIANHFNVGHALASSTITLTTALGVVSVSIWAYLLMP